LHLLGRRNSDNSNFDGVFCHLSFETFFESEEGGVDSVFEGEVVVVSRISTGYTRALMATSIKFSTDQVESSGFEAQMRFQEDKGSK
jgi:hypothetical protein